MLESATYILTGKNPLLMHSDRLANPLDPITKEFRLLSRKRNKTDEDITKLLELEWRANMYYDKDIGPYMPCENIHRMIVNAATAQKLGKTMKAVLFFTEDRVPVEYEGPRTMDEIWQTGHYVYIKTVVQQRSRMIKARPIFNAWSLMFTVSYAAEKINIEQLDEALRAGGAYECIGAWRPKFGRFDAQRVQ